jgi:hypothetical protein
VNFVRFRPDLHSEDTSDGSKDQCSDDDGDGDAEDDSDGASATTAAVFSGGESDVVTDLNHRRNVNKRKDNKMTKQVAPGRHQRDFAINAKEQVHDDIAVSCFIAVSRITLCVLYMRRHYCTPPRFLTKKKSKADVLSNLKHHYFVVHNHQVAKLRLFRIAFALEQAVKAEHEDSEELFQAVLHEQRSRDENDDDNGNVVVGSRHTKSGSNSSGSSNKTLCVGVSDMHR